MLLSDVYFYGCWNIVFLVNGQTWSIVSWNLGCWIRIQRVDSCILLQLKNTALQILCLVMFLRSCWYHCFHKLQQVHSYCISCKIISDLLYSCCSDTPTFTAPHFIGFVGKCFQETKDFQFSNDILASLTACLSLCVLCHRCCRIFV